MTSRMRPPWSPTIVRLGARSVLGRRRGALLVLLPVVLLALAVLVRVLVGTDFGAARDTAYGLGIVVLVPLVALLATSGLLAPEIDDGSVVYLLAKPIARWRIVVSKLLVAGGCTTVFGALPVLVAAGLLRGDAGFALGFGLGAFVGGLAYCALFAWLSAISKHAVVLGLVYLLIWEGLLGGLLDGVRWLSLTQWSAAVVEATAGTGLGADLPTTYAAVALALVVGAGTLLTARGLARYDLRGDE